MPDRPFGGKPVPEGKLPDGRIVVTGLTKEYRGVRAVDNLSFVVEPGRVTGFLGPNGAGKTTTLRMLLNLVEPTSGTAAIGGVRYADLDQPIRRVGGVLEAGAAHKARTGRDHLRIICQSAGIPLERADEVLELVGLTTAGRRAFRGYSLGMRQRLGVAAALIGDPQVLILDVFITGVDDAAIGDAAQRTGIAIHQLVSERPDLEAAYLKLIAGKAAIRWRCSTAPPWTGPATPAPRPLRLVRAEIMKIRTTNTWWLFLIGFAVFTALALTNNGFSHHYQLYPQQDTSDRAQSLAQAAQARTPAGVVAIAASMMTSGQLLGVLFAMILGVLLMTNEFAYQTATVPQYLLQAVQVPCGEHRMPILGHEKQKSSYRNLKIYNLPAQMSSY